MRTFIVAFNMSSSSKQLYQSQIDALSKRLDHQDERFGQLEANIDKLTQAFEEVLILIDLNPPKKFP